MIEIIDLHFDTHKNWINKMLFNSKDWVTIAYLISVQIYDYIHNIFELSGKFVPILKENWNAKDLNFSIHLLNYID